jgi:uncharacterized membrane protein
MWLFNRWDALRTTYWFLPGVMAASAVALAALTLELDRLTGDRVSREWAWTYTGGPEGARAVLSTVAGSMITVAGVVFSITIVALSLATGQFGPRLLRNFIRDRSNQFVLGTFTATFIYCLLVLRTVRGTDDERFVPGISVALGIVLALAGLGVLIYFIHHVAVSIQATQVIATVTDELHETIDRLWPEALAQEPPGPVSSRELGIPPAMEESAAPIPARESGYLVSISDDTLLRLARERDLVVRLAHRPGHFIVRGNPLAFIWPGDRVDDELCNLINGVYTLAAHRTPFQDVEFAIDQLVEIAVRALSPGINDPFTAMTCIDRLGEALCRLCQRSVPSPYRYDEEKRLRVIAPPATFGSIADAAFNQVRQYGRSSAAVLIRMLETLAVVANHARREEDRAALERHAKLVHRASAQGLPEEADRADVEQRYQAVEQALAAR